MQNLTKVSETDVDDSNDVTDVTDDGVKTIDIMID